MTTTEYRSQIAKRYFQNVLWVDDEITYQEGSVGEKFRDFFHPCADEFAKQGFLCHLKSYAPNTGSADIYANTEDLIASKELVTRSDIVIIDWHLGADNPQNAVAIINQVIDSEGTRFCVVLSQEANLDRDFSHQFSDRLSKVGSGHLWSNQKDGKFFLLLQKRDFESDASAIQSLITTIINEATAAFTDVIQWIAIEIMANLKMKIPSLLSRLPTGTDKALIAETLVEDENEIFNFIVTALGEDISDIVSHMKLDTIINRNKDAENDESWNELKSKINAFKIDPKNDFSQVAESIDSDSNLVASYQKLAKLLEQRTLQDVLNDQIYPGAVFQKSTSDAIWVCVSQACDCQSKNAVLIIKGQKMDILKDAPLARTYLMFEGVNYRFTPVAESLKTAEVIKEGGVRKLKDHTYKGGLRTSIMSRLTDRFWGHLTRIGVNQPSVIRKQRKDH